MRIEMPRIFFLIFVGILKLSIHPQFVCECDEIKRTISDPYVWVEDMSTLDVLLIFQVYDSIRRHTPLRKKARF